MESLEETAAEYRFSNCLSALSGSSEKAFRCTEEALHHAEEIKSFFSVFSTSFKPDCNMSSEQSRSTVQHRGIKC